LSTLLQLRGIQGLEEQRAGQRRRGEEMLGITRERERRLGEAAGRDEELFGLTKEQKELDIQTKRREIKTKEELEARRQRFQGRMAAGEDWTQELETEAEILDFNPRNIWPERYRTPQQGLTEEDMIKLRRQSLQDQLDTVEGEYDRWYERHKESVWDNAKELAKGKKPKHAELQKQQDDFERKLGVLRDQVKQFGDPFADFLSGKSGGGQPGREGGPRSLEPGESVPQAFIDDQQELQRMLSAGEIDQRQYDRLLKGLYREYGF